MGEPWPEWRAAKFVPSADVTVVTGIALLDVSGLSSSAGDDEARSPRMESAVSPVSFYSSVTGR
jgi:hypothetical protein